MVRSPASGSLLFAALLSMVGATLAPTTALAGGPYSFYAVTPCRAVDTRYCCGGPLVPLETRLFTVRGVCQVPVDAAAASLNVTVTGATLDGHLRIFPSDQATLPVVSTINWLPGEMGLANGAVVPLAAVGVNTNDLAVYLGTGYTTGSVQVILDVTGYYK
jgi:hypothetical protein